MATFNRLDVPFDPRLWEREVRARWKDERIFARSEEQPAPAGDFVFFEGPPTANNVPHVGHVLTRVMKDVFPRFHTMRGYRVRRKAGWDTHGLPVEIEIEKKLGITQKGQIEELVPGDRRASIAEFNRQCKASVLRYEQAWREVTDRIGFWVDLDSPYFTFSNQYVESVWWILSKMFERGLLYRGYKILPYSPQSGTTYSSHEVAQNFKDDIADPSIYATFRTTDPRVADPTGRETAFLVWTTTPWTLLSNVAICVHPTVDYVAVEVEREGRSRRLILAEALVAEVGLDGCPVVGRWRGEALAGVRYQPLFPLVFEALLTRSDAIVLGAVGGSTPTAEDAFRIVVDDYVTTADGTGLVHQAPAFGEDDHRVAQREGLAFVNAVAPDGTLVPEARRAFAAEVEAAVVAGRLDGSRVAPFTLEGKWVKDFAVGEDHVADGVLFPYLKASGLTLEVPGKSGLKAYRHSYPFCWRHDTPLIYYATDSWFIRTTAFRDELVAANQTIGWVPEWIRDGRMGDWLENVVDWALSRRRYWGTPLPIWVNDRTGEATCVSSYRDLFERAGRLAEYFELEASGKLYDPEAEGGFDPHRPSIDDFTWSDGEGGTWRRVEEVIDAWFDSGAMPFAQLHYPFEKQTSPLAGRYPADFICEAVDQTRGWFYTLHAISIFLSKYVEEVRQDAGLDGPSPAYRHCIVLGHILDDQGRKMSKRLGNVVDPIKVLDEVGADPVRWYLYSATQPWTPTRFSERLLRESTQRLLLPLYNALSFFLIYAEIDGFDPRTPAPAVEQRADLDRWILAAFDRAADEVAGHLDQWRIVEACTAVEQFVDALTNWYIRRSRSRFWSPSGENEADKAAAHRTLWEVLVGASRLVAPFVPFFAEFLHQRLARPFGAADSVHLEAWPQPLGRPEPALEASMTAVRRVVELGRAVRAAHKLKTRQPLPTMTLAGADASLRAQLAGMEGIVLEELNVKALSWSDRPEELVSIEARPNWRVLGKRLGAKMKATAAAIAAEDPNALAASLSANGRAAVEVEGESIELSAEELEIRYQPREGLVAEADRDLLLVLDTTVDEGLRREGLAREVISRVQGLRRDLDLDFTERIDIRYAATGELAAAIEANRELICAEVLARELVLDPLVGAHEFDLDGERLGVAVDRRGGA
jgi:isoleucyl-tRNA synthetase